MRRWVLIVLAGALLLGGVGGWAEEGTSEGAAPSSGPIEDRTRICMLDNALLSKPGVAHQREGRTYYFCCGGCVKRFEEGPHRYVYDVDPVTSAQVDKSEALAYAYQGRAYFFANEANRQAFSKNPETYVTEPIQAGSSCGGGCGG